MCADFAPVSQPCLAPWHGQCIFSLEPSPALVSQFLATSRQHQGLEDVLKKEAKKIGLAEHRALAGIQGEKREFMIFGRRGRQEGEI